MSRRLISSAAAQQRRRELNPLSPPFWGASSPSDPSACQPRSSPRDDPHSPRKKGSFSEDDFGRQSSMSRDWHDQVLQTCATHVVARPLRGPLPRGRGPCHHTAQSRGGPSARSPIHGPQKTGPNQDRENGSHPPHHHLLAEVAGVPGPGCWGENIRARGNPGRNQCTRPVQDLATPCGSGWSSSPAWSSGGGGSAWRRSWAARTARRRTPAG